MKVSANLTFSKVQFDQETEAHLVLGLTTPAVAVEDKRPPLCIVPLLDVSTSMAGDKLTYAKRSLIKLIEHLSPGDYCGLVKFSDEAEIVSKPISCTTENKEELKRKVGELQVIGCTNIADALLRGFAIANAMDLPTEVITRVILFTDGAANRGPAQTPKDIVGLIAPNIGNASVSAFGYGTDVQQDFLLDLAKKGNGNYSFIQNPDGALSAFGKELGGLLSTYGTNLVIEVSPLAGHKITSVLSDVDAEGDLDQVTIRIPDILSEETRNLVLAIKLQPQKNAFPRDVNAFEVKVGYDILDANLRKEHQLIERKAKVRFVKAGEQQEKPDPDLDKIVGLAQLVRAQIEAESHAKKGDYTAAVATMSLIGDNFEARGLEQISVMASNLSSRMQNRQDYSANAAYFAGINRGITRGFGGSYDVSAAADLSSVGISLDNFAQSQTSDSFTGTEAVPMTGAPAEPTPFVPVPISLVPLNAEPIPFVPVPIPLVPLNAGKAEKAKKEKGISQKSKRW